MSPLERLPSRSVSAEPEAAGRAVAGTGASVAVGGTVAVAAAGAGASVAVGASPDPGVDGVRPGEAVVSGSSVGRSESGMSVGSAVARSKDGTAVGSSEPPQASSSSNGRSSARAKIPR